MTECSFLSDPSYHSKNIKLVIDILLCNGYPLDCIFNTINDRLKFLFDKTLCSSRLQALSGEMVVDSERKPSKTFFPIPCLPKISESFKRVLNNYTILSFIGNNRLSRFIKVLKDPLPLSSLSNVVYKIHCNDCDVTYVG